MTVGWRFLDTFKMAADHKKDQGTVETFSPTTQPPGRRERLKDKFDHQWPMMQSIILHNGATPLKKNTWTEFRGHCG